MKLSMEQISVIKKFVDERKYDSKKIVAYLEKHNIIKNNIFAKSYKLNKNQWSHEFGKSTYTYESVDRETFIRRIPFYFYEGVEKRADVGACTYSL